MFTIRAVGHSPVSGGAGFAVAVGPSRAWRFIQWLLRGSTALLLARAAAAPTFLSWSAASLVLLIAAEWIAGGAESLACRGDLVSYRRRRLFRERSRVWPVLDVTRIRPPRRRGWRSERRGLLIETVGGVWTIGAGIAWREANEIATALERHLRLSPPAALSPPKSARFRASRFGPSPASPPAQLERARRFRGPPPR
jgi:hypothetical protein